MLQALLEPTDQLVEFEKQDKRFERMAFLEELKALPWSNIYNYFCQKQGVAIGDAYIKEIQEYEENVTSKRV
jgi:L-rhamnose isomerase